MHDEFMATAGIARLNVSDIPEEAIADVTALSLQFAGEHCTECAAPDCHESCDLFEQGPTGRCRRFVTGLVSRFCRGLPFEYGLEFIAKPWAQVICVGNTLCIDRRRYRWFARWLPVVGRLSYSLQSMFRFMPMKRQWALTDKMRGMGNRIPRMLNRLSWRGHGYAPDALLCIVGNPHNDPLTLEFSVSGFGDSQGGRAFRRSEIAQKGWNVFSIPIEEVAQVIDLEKLFRISMVPLVSERHMLQLMYLGFVSHQRVPMRARLAEAGRRLDSEPAGKKVKLVVFDLDNTLWDGVLVENTGEPYPLRSGVKETLEELDRRGILLSVASKNNVDDARTALEQLGVWDLFLHPRINWQPKSGNIAEIVTALNIGMDTVAFVDDSPFEREEVETGLPGIRVYDAPEIDSLLDRPAFSVSTTSESGRRRSMYVEESARQEALGHTSGDYDEFLRSCEMEMRLTGLNESNRERVHELVQRTNQLNFSGNRYSRDALDRLLASPDTMPIVMHCRDKFGDYGIVGFAIVNVRGEDIEVSDMMYSCRIQGKKVEHAFLAYLLGAASSAGCGQCVCRFRETPRNVHAAAVFADLGFTESEEHRIGGQADYIMACNTTLMPIPVVVVDEAGVEEMLGSLNRR